MSRRILLIAASLIIFILLYIWLNSYTRNATFWTVVQTQQYYYDFLDEDVTLSGKQNNENFVRSNEGQKHFIFRHESRIYKGKAGFTNDFDKILADLDLLPEENVSITSVEKFGSFSWSQEYVFLTAFSNNHYGEATNLLKSISQVYPKQKVLTVYNLGLSEGNIAHMQTFFPSIIREVVNFNFTNYPAYVGDLTQYRWKSLIIAQELKKHRGQNLVWMDSSILLKKPLPMSAHLFKDKKPYSSWLLFDQTGHSIFAATNPLMYNFLPLPKFAYKSLMIGANLQIIFSGINTPPNRFVAEWWVRCSLDPHCMAPHGSHLRCDFQNPDGHSDRFGRYGNCHRFDQSALNILLAWINGFNTSLYGEGHELFKDTFAVERI
uniref:Uncharacterized protein n=1 Tax=Romanomermis culicivorax TaxID=13658 RepID=A0A915JGZ2_ROMCU